MYIFVYVLRCVCFTVNVAGLNLSIGLSLGWFTRVGGGDVDLRRKEIAGDVEGWTTERKRGGICILR